MVRNLPWVCLLSVLSAGFLIADAGSPPEVDVRFMDGSTARVVILQSHLELETRYGKLTIPCNEIRKIELALRLEDETAKRIDDAIRELGGDEFNRREAASKELLRLAIPAYVALKKTPPSKDPEVAKRTEAIFKQIESSIPAAKLQVRSNDLIQTKEFTVTGRIPTRQLKVKSKYFGETELKLNEVSSMNSTAKAPMDLMAPWAEKGPVFKAAHLLEIGDFFAAKQTIEAFAKDKQVEDLALLFARRTKQGPRVNSLGIGPTPGAFQPDGIEQLIIQLDSDRLIDHKLLERHADDLSRAFYITAVIGEGHRSHCPVKQKTGKKDPKDWDRWCLQLRDSAFEMAGVVQDKQPKTVREVAKRLNNACFSCHDVFRDCN
jgi:hypothetical protein